MERKLLLSTPQNVDKAAILAALRDGELDVQGQFMLGSNYTFLGRMLFNALELPVVYKPRRGEQPLWDFPRGTLTKREAAAFWVSEALGWNLVPPTIYRKKMPLGPGSVQHYIEHDPEYHYFRFDETDRERLRPVVVFDMLINNADRKAGHILRDTQGHLWLIDHGICFHTEDKLRTVLWDFAGEKIPNELKTDLQRLLGDLEHHGEWFGQLKGLLLVKEIRALAVRLKMLLQTDVFPFPPQERRSYPWPPI